LEASNERHLQPKNKQGPQEKVLLIFIVILSEIIVVESAEFAVLFLHVEMPNNRVSFANSSNFHSENHPNAIEKKQKYEY